jgi:hypothetical protein
MSEHCTTRTCVRVLGHAGVCTAAPSARTLDWDTHQADRRHAHETLLWLDFEIPADMRRWVDGLD